VLRRRCKDSSLQSQKHVMRHARIRCYCCVITSWMKSALSQLRCQTEWAVAGRLCDDANRSAVTRTNMRRGALTWMLLQSVTLMIAYRPSFASSYTN
jgi:hypothetical protein